MPKRQTPNDLYLNLMKKNQVKAEYNQFLATQERENTPDSAQIFAMQKIADNHKYQGMTERELILFLAGALPYMYD
jgi:hypothetical protein